MSDLNTRRETYSRKEMLDLMEQYAAARSLYKNWGDVGGDDHFRDPGSAHKWLTEREASDG